MLEDILRYCGYDNAFDLINNHYDEDDMVHLVMDLINSPEDAVDFVKETVEEIAEKYYEWVDLDAAKAQAEDMAYAKYRDGE
tara:strand:+ start:244 stop:489 length:246 start_codon:yes stop_codon:yes gene_type:complete